MAQSSFVAVQAFAIVGAFVGGWLARQRRLELENTNRKLRHINTELRRRQTEVLSCLPLVSNASSSALLLDLPLYLLTLMHCDYSRSGLFCLTLLSKQCSMRLIP